MTIPKKLYATYGHDDIWHIGDSNGSILGTIATVWNIDRDDGEKAMRLAACWNACINVPDEELKEVDLRVAVLANVMRQRDQAEARVEELEATIDSINGLGTLGKFFEALGWQGGTIHDDVAEVKRLAESDRRQEAKPLTVDKIMCDEHCATCDNKCQPESNETAEIAVLYEIRKIIEPVPGKLMQDELVEEIRKLKNQMGAKPLTVEQLEKVLTDTFGTTKKGMPGFEWEEISERAINIAQAIHAAIYGEKK